MQIDLMDRKILGMLQQDASLSAGQIGDAIGLSQSQCWRRIERLQAAGIIQRRIAVLDRKRLGLNVVLFAQVKLLRHGENAVPEFTSAVQQFPEIVECHTLLGNVDFLLKIVTTDLEAYERFFVGRLSRLPMVQEVNTLISLSEIKTAAGLPLDNIV
jgi:Lrp/AsnC family transcriptional regulator